MDTSEQLAVKILIVDDQESNLTAYEAALSGKGYELAFARSGYQAHTLAKTDNYAVILLDVQMPILNGFETAKLIRSVPHAKHTPIIFVTANFPTESYALQGYEAGAVDYLYKPLNIDILRAKVAVFADLFRAKVDVQQLRKTEQALREAIKMRDDFLSMASHELKTPLTPLQLQMQAFVRMIETGKLPTVSLDKLKRMLQISDSQVTRVSRLIDQLLDVSRINEGRFYMQREHVDLSQVITDVTEQFSHSFEAANTELVMSLTPGIVGNWDKLRVERVIVNLLTNALKYGDGKPIEVKTWLDGTTARIAVRDQGIGIAKADQERIFGRFERAVSNENFSGLGLGLYITQRILELHGGRIEVDSDLGQGATFTIALPAGASTSYSA